jgi:hypothetical protein
MIDSIRRPLTKEGLTAAPPSGKTYALVHGAWHGGWCWREVADTLRGMGHHVSTPTQTGVGERKHLLGKNITLDTLITRSAAADSVRTHATALDWRLSGPTVRTPGR